MRLAGRTWPWRRHLTCRSRGRCVLACALQWCRVAQLYVKEIQCCAEAACAAVCDTKSPVHCPARSIATVRCAEKRTAPRFAPPGHSHCGSSSAAPARFFGTFSQRRGRSFLGKSERALLSYQDNRLSRTRNFNYDFQDESPLSHRVALADTIRSRVRATKKNPPSRVGQIVARKSVTSLQSRHSPLRLSPY